MPHGKIIHAAPYISLAEFRPQGEIKSKSCYPAASLTGNILLASQVWNFAPWCKIMRAVEAQFPFSK